MNTSASRFRRSPRAKIGVATSTWATAAKRRRKRRKSPVRLEAKRTATIALRATVPGVNGLSFASEMRTGQNIGRPSPDARGVVEP